MKETTAYAIVKKLRAAGHNVSIKDAPPEFPGVPDHKPPVDYDDLAVVGAAGMSKADVEARVMRLKGYGNAICVDTAALFIKACDEVLNGKLTETK